MQDIINFRYKGHVTIQFFGADGKLLYTYERENALTSDAPEIQCKCLAGQDMFISHIRAFKASGELASQVIGTVNYPTANTVEFIAIFNEASFNDTFDELRLTCNTPSLDFSILTGLSITKDNTKSMAITWKLTAS